MRQQNYAPLRLDEWEQVERRATAKFQGVMPTFALVKETVTNPNRTTWVMYVAMFTLLVVGIFTTIKVSSVAVPFANTMIDELSHSTEISELVSTVFIAVTMVLFSLLATPALIYFKLLDEDEEIVRQKKDSKHIKGWTKIFNLTWLTPRLPMLVVYISVMWLFIISLAGVQDDKSFWWIERLLPVIVEVALATTVGRVISAQGEYNRLVQRVYEGELKLWKSRLADKETNKDYLALISRYMHIALFSMRRSGRKVNAWVEKADQTTLQPILLAEYKRLTDGQSFAKAVLTGQTEPVVAVVTGRTPPNGAKEWLPRTLREDFQKRGLDPEMKYTQSNLDSDYKGSVGFRNAFRGGGNAFFTMHRKE